MQTYSEFEYVSHPNFASFDGLVASIYLSTHQKTFRVLLFTFQDSNHLQFS